MLKGYLFLLAGYCKAPEEREREKLKEGQLNKKEPRLAGFENSQPLQVVHSELFFAGSF